MDRANKPDWRGCPGVIEPRHPEGVIGVRCKVGAALYSDGCVRPFAPEHTVEAAIAVV